MTKKAVTMSDIAKEMNVSTVTVSKALGDRDGVSAELRDRIKRKATEMGYRVHAGTHGAKDGLTYNIGIIVAKHFISDASSFYWIVYRYIVELLQKQNYYGMLEVVSDKDINGVPAEFRARSQGRRTYRAWSAFRIIHRQPYEP